MKSLQFPSRAIVNLVKKEPMRLHEIFQTLHSDAEYWTSFIKRIKRLISEGYIVEKDGRFCLPDKE